MIQLTKMEKDVILNGFGKNEVENNGSAVGEWSIQPNCENVDENQISGVISSLVKKGLAITEELVDEWSGDIDNVVGLTVKGKDVLKCLINEVDEMLITEAEKILEKYHIDTSKYIVAVDRNADNIYAYIIFTSIENGNKIHFDRCFFSNEELLEYILSF